LSAHSSTSLLTRPGTVATLGLVVSALAVAALVQTPASAAAPESSDAPAPVSVAGSAATTTGTHEPIRLARLVEANIRAAAREQREERAERRAARERREARQERRQQARAAARAAARAPEWVLPVPGAGWSASFGEAGSAWSSGYHTGQDFTAPSGTPVLAAGDGTITSATWSDAYGNIIELTHPNGDQSWYAHLSNFAATSGAVEAGDVIGYVGCTGNCYGNHLHFEYHPGGGDAADPVSWLRSNGAL
jgi:murein DD-endopeptidase MepM/ murein hydrolase activator NlpD